MIDFLNGIEKLHQAKAKFIGDLGESALNKFAQENLSNDYYIFSDIVLKANNGTTQIDQIIVSKFGLFVVEIKNYSGYIFGNEQNAQWTQTLPTSKYKFQNPLRQNYKHIKTLQELLHYKNDKFKSLVVFSCRAKFMTKLPINVVIGSIDYINFIKKYQDILLSDKSVEMTIEKIVNNRLTSTEHQAHIEKMKDQYNNANSNNAPQCPRCSNSMVLRTSKAESNKGSSFWGCSQYPRCKAIINIKGDEQKIREELKKIERLFKYFDNLIQ